MSRPQNPDQKTWDEFRSTGLMTFVNTFLHIFGWVIVCEYTNDEKHEFVKAYPARTSWRGFPENAMTKAYENLTKMLATDIDQLQEDVKE